MSGIMIAVLVAFALVVAAGMWVFWRCCGTISRQPEKIKIMLPEGEAFPNGRLSLTFVPDYSLGVDISKGVLFNAFVGNTNTAGFAVPKDAELTGIKLWCGGEDDPVAKSFAKTYWPRFFLLPDDVMAPQAITLQFSVPGDKRGISHHFRFAQA